MPRWVKASCAGGQHMTGSTASEDPPAFIGLASRGLHRRRWHRRRERDDGLCHQGTAHGRDDLCRRVGRVLADIEVGDLPEASGAGLAKLRRGGLAAQGHVLAAD